MTRHRVGIGRSGPRRGGKPPDPLHDRVRSLKDEFHFAAECLRCLINEENDPDEWNTSYNVPVPSGPPLFTPNIRRAIHRMVAEELAIAVGVAITSWFDKTVTTEASRTLLHLMAADYLSEPFAGPRGFLAFCAAVAEISAFSFFAGAAHAPEYGMGCVLFVVKECADKGVVGPAFWAELDALAVGIVKEGGGDPEADYLSVLQDRRNILLIDYDSDNNSP